MQPEDGAWFNGALEGKYTWRCGVGMGKPDGCTSTDPTAPIYCSCTTRTCASY